MPGNEGTQPTPNHPRAAGPRAAGRDVLLHGVQGAGNHSSLLLLHLGVLFLDSVCLAFVEGLSGAQPFPFLQQGHLGYFQVLSAAGTGLVHVFFVFGAERGQYELS